MSWKRLATFALGGAMAAVGFVVPPAAAVLIPAGVGILGYATSWPGDKKRIKKLQEDIRAASPTIAPIPPR